MPDALAATAQEHQVQVHLLIGLIHNAALLISLVVLHETVARSIGRQRLLFRVASGLLFGIMGVLVMMTPVSFAPGVIYDGRSIVLTLAGLFGGALPATIAAVACGAYRLHLGGAGALVGVAVVVESAALGVIVHHLRHRDPRWTNPLRLLALGVLVHVIMLAAQLGLPGGTGWDAVRRIGLTVVIGYPLVFLLAAQVFLEGERRRAASVLLARSEHRYRRLFEHNHAVMLLIAPDDGAIADVNAAGERFYGWTRAELLHKNLRDLGGFGTAKHAEVAASANGAHPAPLAARHLIADGTSRDVEVFTGSLDIDGRELQCLIIHDVTQRVQAERHADRQRTMLTRTEALAHIGSWEWDLGIDRVTWSDELFRIFGLEPADQAPPFAEHQRAYLPADRECLIAAVERCANDGSSYELEAQLARPDGEVRTCIVSGRAERDDSGGIARLVGSVHDVTGRRRAEQELHDQRRRLSFVIEASRLGTWQWDIPTDELVVNEEWAAMIGQTAAELDPCSSRTWSSRLHPDDIPAVRAQRDACLAGQITDYEVEFRMRHADGHWVWILARGRVMTRNETGAPVAMFGTHTDISARKKAEEALTESHALLENLARQVPGVIYQYRLFPDGRSAFPYSSPGMKLIYEVSPDDVREDATPVFGRLHPEDAGGVSEAILESARTLETFFADFRVVLPEQGVRWRWCQADPVRLDDGSVLWHGIILDVTERQLAEIEQQALRDQLTQAQKLESVGRLAGGVAHDFNNMLNVILGHAELALDEVDTGSPLHDHLEQITQSAQRSVNLTRQLLAFARKQTATPRVLDLDETVSSMLKMLGRLIGEDVELVWRPGSADTRVFIDPAQVDQLLANLCVNARDAIGQGPGKIVIETGMATFDDDYCAANSQFRPGDYVVLAVSDDGCGMERETLASIFEPFYTTKGPGEGTGLGLATVYGVVKQNDGFINVYSEPGQGSTFRIYLPRYAGSGPAEARDQGNGAPPSRGDETVMIVEDEAAILELTRTMLERLGYTVITAATPVEAIGIAAAQERPIDLLITDVVMPEMNGRDLVVEVLAQHPGLRHVYMSGYTADVIAHQGVLDEGVDFIQKPFSSANLAAKVREVLDRRR
jgi:PAS domain S-box-containing protein